MPNDLRFRSCTGLSLALLLAAALPAQRPLNHDDYDQWQSLRGTAFSADGQWVAYQIAPAVGDGVLEVRETSGAKIWRFPRGSGLRFSADGRFAVFSIGRSQEEERQKKLAEVVKAALEPKPAAGEGPQPAGGAGAGSAEERRAEMMQRMAGARGGRPGGPGGPGAGGGRRGPGGGAGGGEESAARGEVTVLDLASGKTETLKKVKGWTLPEETPWLIYHLESASEAAEAGESKEGEPKEGEKPAGETAAKTEPKTEQKAEQTEPPATQSPAEGPRGGRGGRSGRGNAPAAPVDPMERKRKEGSTLVLRDLVTGTERRVDHVVAYGLFRKGSHLWYHTSQKKPDAAVAHGLHVDQIEGGKPIRVLAGVCDVGGVTFDKAERAMAFTSNLLDFAAEKPKSDIYLWEGGLEPARRLISEETAGFPGGYQLGGGASFSKDGSVLEFRVTTKPEPETPQILADEKVLLDLWHWNDGAIQPAQARGAGRRSTSRSAVWHRAEGRLVVIADDVTESVRLITPDGSRGLATDSRPYEKLTSWDGRYSDVYLVNTQDGSRTRILERLRGNASASPTGRYLLWFVGGHWHTYDVATGERRNLTEQLPVVLANEDDDRPEADSSFGVAGWTEGDGAVVLYDEFDLWQVSPKTGEAVCVTDGFGRANRTVLRHLPVERDRDVEHLPAELLLSATNKDTMAEGLYRDWLEAVRKPVRVFQIDKNLEGVQKAKKADRWFFTVQTFAEPPDLWTCAGDFAAPVKLTALNPQQREIRWGKAELVHWVDGDGKPARGILVKPDGFDPAKKHPMLVYFYERMSNNLHRYVPPAAGTSPNASYYVSNGYLFFMPDITYEVGYPGASCVKAVVSGVQHLIAQGFVDPNGIGAAGHSWGGYQTAFLVTRTNIFKAVESGAPVSNMISAYGGIRYGTGVSRQFQYERTQSRIGGTPWEYPMRFWENSPIFFADKVQTPVLILHNDQDGAVPWTNGIEFFMALRRLGKEAYLFNYTGEDHGLAKAQNKRDWTRRMAEYFDHHLRGAPMPDWMRNGVPYAEREKEKLPYAPSWHAITKAKADQAEKEAKAAAAKAAAEAAKPAAAVEGAPAEAAVPVEAASERGGREVPPAATEPPGKGGGTLDRSRPRPEGSVTPGGTVMLQSGSKAPDFAVPDETGKVRTLAEFAGRTVVLWFYPKADTPG